MYLILKVIHRYAKQKLIIGAAQTQVFVFGVAWLLLVK